MELTPKTRLSALLSAYPFLKDFLMKLNPNFKALDNPMMMKTLGRVATLGQAAMMGGMDAGELMSKLAAEIKARTGDAPTLGSDTLTPDERQEILKGIIRDLHAGADMGLLKRRFLELIKDVSPAEIANMEQRLISEGMPEDEVKRLCSVHVEVFKESLDKKAMPGLPAGHPVAAFMAENRHAEAILHKMAELGDMSKLTKLLDALSEIEKHYARKENQLFPVVEARGITGPSKVMWAVDDDIRAKLKDVKAKASSGKATKADIEELSGMISDMIYKEEHILFPMALETLTDEDWLKVATGGHEIGYAWVKPAETMQPSGAGPSIQPGAAGSMNLDTGRLTLEQLNLMLTHLPVDLSFVNDQDEVVYYSATPERIFPRSPAIIGRKVQNCHPPKSVHVVENILDAFRAGRKDSAEFWIQLKGRFLHIRYFAVRDEAGTYRGTLEVSQDVTGIRALEGEQRLLDWD